ncbi:MAG TPA: GNAT family N-acetyltransferase [Bacillota bacterium]
MEERNIEPDVLRRIRPGGVADWPAIIELAFAREAVAAQLSPFRSWTVEDVLAVRRQIVQAWQDRLQEAKTHALFIAEGKPDGRAIGYVMVIVSDSPAGRQGWVMELGVDKALWSRGIGTALLRKAEEFSVAHGAKYLGLGVSSNNERALRLYERMGYHEERRHLVKKL